MHSVYEELLSFEGLDEAVNRLYKAYLDMRLMEFEDATKPIEAKEAVEAKPAVDGKPAVEAEPAVEAKPADDGEYWRRVKDFRRKALDPYTDLASPAPGDDEDTDAQRAKRRELVTKAIDAFSQGKVHYEYARAFLYWYDLRAQAWVNDRPDDRVRELLVPAKELKSLHEQALALEKRLRDADRHAKHYKRPYKRSAGAAIVVATATKPADLMPIIVAVEKDSKPPPPGAKK